MAEGLPMSKNQLNAFVTITGSTNLGNSHDAIKSNLIFQTIGLFCLILLYLVFRRKAPWVYYPNIKNSPCHPCYQESPSFLSWLGPLFTIKDTSLLAIAGLDSFMFLQTIKLLYRICLIVAVFSTPILVYNYHQHRDYKDMEFFQKITISRHDKIDIYLIIVLASYILSLFILYLIFIYYKRFVTLRQIYFASPATMTSVPHLKKLSNVLGSDVDSVDYVDIASRTVLIDRLPNEIKTEDDLKKYMESLEIGEIECVSLVYNTHTLQKLYERRDATIQNMEKEIAIGYKNLKELFENKNNIEIKESFGDLHLGKLESSVLSKFTDTKLSICESNKLFNIFLNKGDKFLPKTWFKKIGLGVYLDELNEINNDILEEKKKLEDVGVNEEKITVPEAGNTLYDATDIKNDVSFFSFEQIFNFRKNRSLFTVDLPFNKKRAFVTFKDQKLTGIIKQTLLGTRAFSSNITNAPAPYDVMWKNLSKSEAINFISEIFSTLMFIFLNIGFMYFATLIISSLDVKKNTSNAIFQLPFIKNNKTFHSIYKGVFAPLVYNILLYFVPILLKSLINMEDTISFSCAQSKLMHKLTIFLFFNGFISTVIISLIINLFDIFNETEMDYNLLVKELSNSIILSSGFFLNLVIQRLCIGSALVLLKPPAFIYNFLIAPFFIKTRRQEQERRFSPPIDFGNHISNLLLIIPIALVYNSISPIIVYAAFLFYLFSYLIYKNELMYSTRNDYESGGTYWRPTTRFIMLSIVFSQISNFIITFTSGFKFVSFFYLPLMVATCVISYGIDEIFEKSSENFPMNKPEEDFINFFAKKVFEERCRLLNEWKDIGEMEDPDVIPISEMGFSDKNANINDSFYKDPCIMLSIGRFILPRNFFISIKFLKTFDKDNITGLN